MPRLTMTRITIVFAAVAQLLAWHGLAAGQTSPPGAKDAAAPVAPSAAPVQLRVYNSDIHDSANADLGGSPVITLFGTRNGVCSGKVVVAGSPLQGVQATVGALKQGASGAATIPAAQVSVRYGMPWANGLAAVGDGLEGSDVLFEKPLPEFSAGKIPVWVTVQVPKTARPGSYTGELTITVKGGGPFKVPVKLSVQDWTLPDTQDWRTWMEVIQSPDNLAVEYQLPLWSEKHWQMIGKSLKLIGSIGSRVVYIPLICHANFGNEESMVRWIKKGDKYEYDFTVMEKYLDTAQANMGRPKIVTLWMWDVYLSQPSAGSMSRIKGDEGDSPTLRARAGLKGKGLPVTVYDPATKKTEMVYLPPYDTPEGKALWQPLWKELRRRLEARGLWDAAMLGVSSDIWPTKEQTAALAELSGGLPWSSSTHHISWLPQQTATGKGALHEVGFLKYVSVILAFEMTINPSLPGARTYGWKNPVLAALHWRGGHYNWHGPAQLRHEPMYAITGDRCGLSHIGGDFWYTFKDSRGRLRSSVSTRYPESGWHSQAILGWVLAPSPEGPVATARFEAMREGVQECETRIAIETVLTDPKLRAKLGNDLAQRAQDFLDEHQRNGWRARGALEEDIKKWGHVPNYRTFSYDIVGIPKQRWNEAAGAQWFIKSGWADRVGKLYALANEVSQKAGR